MAIVTGTNASDPELEGTDLADQIFGLGGNDILIGLGGDDVLEGGAGGDLLFGSPGFDYASYRGSDRSVRIDLQNFEHIGGHADNDNLFSIEGVIGSAFQDSITGDDGRNILRGEAGDDGLSGGADDDTLQGGNGSDFLNGGVGNDLVDGGNDNDFLIGSGGNDQVRGGAGIDTIGFFFSSSGVVADLAGGTASGDGSIGTDRLSGIENLDGTPFADRLAGNGGANVIKGSYGADVLIGRGGADRFVYHFKDESAPEAPDRILDFSRAQGDKIDLAVIDANEQVTGSQAFKFIGQGQLTGVGQLRSFKQTGDTVIEANTTDLTAGAELRIELDPLVSMQAGDFFL